MPELPEPIPHTIEAIYKALAATARGSDSRGVPMSDVANECERAIWMKLRWACPPEEITGQKQRRFGTGLREEERLLDDLVAAGIQVERVDPATGTQFRVELANGWLRGRMDGRATGIPEAPKTMHVVEIKTHNDRSFKDLIKKKLQASKPDHYAQCQAYCHAEHLTRCLYLAVNKNTDELYAERVEYNAVYALQLEAKVSRIVNSDRAPPRLFEDPTAKNAYPCGWCSAFAQCHEKAFARRNCRTCISASFEDGANVRCAFFNKILSYDEQQRGCDNHLYLPSLVPAEQIDASEADRTITYRLVSGETWMDGKE
jgi:hypothetical protein